MSENASLQSYFDFAPIKDRIPMRLRESVLSLLEDPQSDSADTPSAITSKLRYSNYTKQSKYTLDEPLISKMIWHFNEILTTENMSMREKAFKELLATMRQFAENRQEKSEKDLKVEN